MIVRRAPYVINGHVDAVDVAFYAASQATPRDPHQRA
jgi:hypothetical protein